MAVQQYLLEPASVLPALVDPLLKYAGSKRWLVKLLALRLHAHLVNVNGVYLETFAGSFALGLGLGWSDSIYADTNPDIVNLHQVLASDAVRFVKEVDALRSTTGEAAYYRIRESVWPENRDKIDAATWAARTLWLNKNCFNGLLRFGQKNGHFNVPWGKRENVALPANEHIFKVSAVLRAAKISRQDFAFVLHEALKDHPPHRLVIFLDPPYGGRLENVDEVRPGKDAGVFTGYTGVFTWKDQVRLAKWANFLAQSGALVIASNSWTEKVCDLYRDSFALFQVGVQHSVGATGERRGKRAEMLAVSKAHAGIVESTPYVRKQ